MKYGEIHVDVDEKGRIIVGGDPALGDESICLTEREARWLAIVGLPAMLPGIKSPAEQADERRDRG